MKLNQIFESEFDDILDVVVTDDLPGVKKFLTKHGMKYKITRNFDGFHTFSITYPKSKAKILINWFESDYWGNLTNASEADNAGISEDDFKRLHSHLKESILKESYNLITSKTRASKISKHLKTLGIKNELENTGWDLGFGPGYLIKVMINDKNEAKIFSEVLQKFAPKDAGAQDLFDELKNKFK